MRCPKCNSEIRRCVKIEEPAPHVALAPKRIMKLKCPHCGYSETEVIPYSEAKRCPKCGQEENVVRMKDTQGSTKIGYLYYCTKCELKFPAEWR